MKLKLEDYFLVLSSSLGWSFLGYREDLNKMAQGLSAYVTGNSPETFLALHPESFITFNLSSQEGFPSRVQNFEVLEGATRTLLFTFFLITERSENNEAFQILEILSSYLRNNWHEETRIGLGNVAMNTEAQKVLYRIEAFFPLTNSFT